VLTIVAAAAMTSTTGAESNHQQKVLCGNFGGQTMAPHLARKPKACDVTRLGHTSTVVNLRKMHWGQWGGHAKGKGKVNGKKRAVRLRKTRPCGQHGEFSVYSQMRLGAKKWRKILYCGD
jgi:hypothetical protein